MEDKKGITHSFAGIGGSITVWHHLKVLSRGIKVLKVYIFRLPQNLKRASIHLLKLSLKKDISLKTLLKRVKGFLLERSLNLVNMLGTKAKYTWLMKNILNGRATKLVTTHFTHGFTGNWEKPKDVTELVANIQGQMLLNRFCENLNLSSGLIFRTNIKENYQTGYNSVPRAMHDMTGD